MFVIGNFLNALASVIDMVATVIIWLIIARAILSWVSPDPNNPIVRAIYQMTEPLLYPIRSRLPYMGGMDLSPIVTIIAVIFLSRFLVPTLQEIGQSML